MRTRSLSLFLLTVLAAATLAGRADALHKRQTASPGAAAAAADEPAALKLPSPEIYRGSLVNTAAARGSASSTFELHLDALTSDAELARLTAVDTEKGQDALINELYRTRLGFIRVGMALGYPVGLARHVRTAQGDMLYAVMNRPLQLAEIWQDQRSRDYPFSVVEIQIGSDGKLTGNVYPITQLELLPRGNFHINDLLSQPFRLIGLTREKR